MSLLYAIWRTRRAGLLRLRRVSGPTRLKCIGGECGLCCQVMGGGVVVSDEEVKSIDQTLLIRRERTILRKDDSGACVALKSRCCSIYRNRPRGCHEYPWYNINGQLFFDVGCPGIRHDFDEHPKAWDLRPIQIYMPGLPMILRQIVFWIVRVW
jgi:Fe-S-cluster containining protein